jgi:hypothetical protein
VFGQPRLTVVDPSGTSWKLSLDAGFLPDRFAVPLEQRPRPDGEPLGCLGWLMVAGAIVTFPISVLVAPRLAYQRWIERHPGAWVLVAEREGSGAKPKMWITPAKSKKQATQDLKILARHIASGKPLSEFR